MQRSKRWTLSTVRVHPSPLLSRVYTGSDACLFSRYPAYRHDIRRLQGHRLRPAQVERLTASVRAATGATWVNAARQRPRLAGGWQWHSRRLVRLRPLLRRRIMLATNLSNFLLFVLPHPTWPQTHLCVGCARARRSTIPLTSFFLRVSYERRCLLRLRRKSTLASAEKMRDDSDKRNIQGGRLEALVLRAAFT